MIKNKTLDIKIILKILKTGFCLQNIIKLTSKPRAKQTQNLFATLKSLQRKKGFEFLNGKKNSLHYFSIIP